MEKIAFEAANRPNRERHEQVHIRYGDFEADVDVGIVPLILEIWKAGIETMMSCEDNRGGWVWIAFPVAECAEHFLNCVARYEEDIYSLYNRIRHAWTPPTPTLDGWWEYDLMVDDMAVTWEELEDGTIEESCTDPSDFSLSVSIRFPRSDLSVVMKNLAEYNRGENRR